MINIKKPEPPFIGLTLVFNIQNVIATANYLHMINDTITKLRTGH